MANANANWAFEQGAGNVLLGSLAGYSTEHTYDDIQRLFSNAGAVLYSGLYDDFLGAALDSRWNTDVSTGATVAVNAQQDGAIRLSTDTDDDDHATLSLGLHWLVSKGYTFFEARVKTVTASTLRAIEVGLSDALSETNGLAFSDHSVAGVTAVATDAAIIGFDTDASMTNYALDTVNAGGTAAAVTTGVAPSTSYQRLGLIVDSAGNCYCFIAGVLVATALLAVATTSVLTPWISLKSLSGAIKSIDVDYVSISGVR